MTTTKQARLEAIKAEIAKTEQSKYEIMGIVPKSEKQAWDLSNMIGNLQAETDRLRVKYNEEANKEEDPEAAEAAPAKMGHQREKRIINRALANLTRGRYSDSDWRKVSELFEQMGAFGKIEAVDVVYRTPNNKQWQANIETTNGNKYLLLVSASACGTVQNIWDIYDLTAYVIG